MPNQARQKSYFYLTHDCDSATSHVVVSTERLSQTVTYNYGYLSNKSSRIVITGSARLVPCAKRHLDKYDISMAYIVSR